MPQENFNDVVITGNQDITQLQVKGNTTQTDSLTSWQNSAGEVLAEVREDGRVLVGNEISFTPPNPDALSALLEAHRDSGSTTKPKRGIHSLGRISNALNAVSQWIVAELEVRGSDALSALQTALRVKISNMNDGTPTSGAELRGGDIEVINDSSASTSALPKATGLQVSITNASTKTIDEAVGLKVKMSDEGTITTPFSIYTEGKGPLHLEDYLEVMVSDTPATPAPDFVRIYLKADGKLYAKSWSQAEIELGGGGGTATVIPATCNGRLTLTTAVPVTTSDVTAATTLYFTPFKGRQVALYDGTDWVQVNFSERSLSLSGLAANTNHDIFLYDNSGTLTLEAVAWTNNTTRATGLGKQDDIYVKSGAAQRRYLGTIRTTATTGQTEDSQARRLVWNYYNRVEKPLVRRETTANWNYSTGTARAANANNANRVEIVTGLAEDAFELSLHVSYLCTHTSSIGFSIGIGEDSTTTVVTEIVGGRIVAPGDGGGIATAHVEKVPPVGYHYYQWTEAGAGLGTQSWFAGTGVNSGLVGAIKA